MMADGRASWFVGWGTLALINAGLAQGKNRSGLLWFLLSLVFGPFATLAVVLLPSARSKLF
ncbi:MAG: antitermination protein NusB [Rhodanobacter sp.]